MAEFKIGDSVWAFITPDGARFGLPRGREVSASITYVCPTDGRRCIGCKKYRHSYKLDIVPKGVTVCGCVLRPRRDDYQQHEGLGSRDKLTTPLGDDPLPQREKVFTPNMVYRGLRGARGSIIIYDDIGDHTW